MMEPNEPKTRPDAEVSEDETARPVGDVAGAQAPEMVEGVSSAVPVTEPESGPADPNRAEQGASREAETGDGASASDAATPSIEPQSTAATEPQAGSAETAEVAKQEGKPEARSRDAAEVTPTPNDAEGGGGAEQTAESAARPADPEDADDVLTRKKAGTEAADAEVLAQSRRRTRRSFVVAAAGAAAGYGFYRYLDLGPQSEVQPDLLRRSFLTDAAISRGVFDEAPLAPTYPLRRAETLRTNGVFGLKMPLKLESWRLQVVGTGETDRHPRFSKDVTAYEYEYATGDQHEDKGHDTKVDPSKTTAEKMAPEGMVGKAQEDENHTGRKPRGMEESGESDSTLPPGTPGLLLTMADVMALPRHELVTQFKCIEGWSQIVHWAGVRMRDFLERYPPAKVDGKEPPFVYMETPNGDYYCGYDLKTMRHPQTLLVTEMMGAPLTQLHGAPLRLHMPTKYGYKQLKRIGLIAYTTDKPDDYWTKLGYDWYAGL